MKNTRASLPTANLTAISDSVGRAVKAKVRRRRTQRKEAQKAEKEEDSEGEDVEVPVVDPTPEWQNEFDEPDQWIPLRRSSDKFDITDPFWSNHFISVALKTMDRILEQDTAEDVAYPATQENHEDDVPTIEKTFESVEALFEHIASEDQQAKEDLHEVPSPSKIETAATESGLSDISKQLAATDESCVEDLIDSTDRTAIFNGLSSFLQEAKIWQTEIENMTFTDDAEQAPIKPSTIIQATDSTAEILQGVDNLADNPELQRDNIDGAVSALGIECSGDIYKMPGMRINRRVFKWQVLAAHAAYEAWKDKKLIGHLNADDVGLGKTWSTLTFLLKVP